MARIHPFQAYRYGSKAGNPSDLVTQPYDKIPDELRERYLAASPYNFVRLIKGPEEPAFYAEARTLLDQWIADGILVQDPAPAIYPYQQEFDHPDSAERLVRKAFIATLELENYENGVVYRHELTHRGPKVDRLRLTEATGAYFGQLFFLYDEPKASIDQRIDAAVAAAPPLMEVEEQGVRHRL